MIEKTKTKKKQPLLTLASSTKIISFKYCKGVFRTILTKPRSRVEFPSL
jgi:hypothetical protein